MNKTFKEIKAGDEVYLVEEDRRHKNPRYIKVSKVGRKYIHLDLGYSQTQKVEEWDFNSYAIGSSNDFPRCLIYPSKEDYDEMVRWQLAVSKIADITYVRSISRETRNTVADIILAVSE